MVCSGWAWRYPDSGMWRTQGWLPLESFRVSSPTVTTTVDDSTTNGRMVILLLSISLFLFLSRLDLTLSSLPAF